MARRRSSGQGADHPASATIGSVLESPGVDRVPDPASGPADVAAAGRYICSVYSWSIRVVEKRHIVLAIDARINWTHDRGSPSASRS
jgi:hypothetical protein